MFKYLQIVLIFLGVWVIASFLNGLLSGISIALLENGSYYGENNISISMFASFLFSIPFVGITWLISSIAFLAGKRGDPFFQLILGTVLFCSVTAAIGFINTIGEDFKQARYAVGLSIVVSAMGSVMVFRNSLKTME